MLKYVGSGFIPGIPARDLSDNDLERLQGWWNSNKEGLDASNLEEFLVNCGLFEPIKPGSTQGSGKPGKPENIEKSEKDGE